MEKFHDLSWVPQGGRKTPDVGPIKEKQHMGVSKIGVPQNGWFIMENLIKMDDLGVPLFSETLIFCVAEIHQAHSLLTNFDRNVDELFVVLQELQP